jgi:S1-C subfamily serine protease
MRRFWLGLVALLSLPQTGVAAVPAHLASAIAVLAVHDPQTRRYVGIGSTFHLGRGSYYTNAHVVLAARRFQREEPKFEQWILIGGDEFGSPRLNLGTVEVRCVDRRYQPDPYGEPQPYDVAMVRLINALRPLPPPLTISRGRVAVGDRVRALGFPDTSVLFEMRGTVTEVGPQRIVVERERGTAVLPGSSGSPLFNARDEVIGVLQAGNVGQLSSVSVPIQTALVGCALPND